MQELRSGEGGSIKNYGLVLIINKIYALIPQMGRATVQHC